MDVVDLEDAAAELYALTPADFTARRSDLTAQARKDGGKELAKAISELRRPTVSAWLVNQLARGAGGAGPEVEELEQLGTDLREAQGRLDGPRMKELTKRRHELVASLVRRAEAVAADGGQKLSAGAQRELEETFGAAVADEQASLAVTSGRLTRALVYAGFGDVDVTAATATPVTAKERHLSSAPAPRPGRREPGSSSGEGQPGDRGGRRPGGRTDRTGGRGEAAATGDGTAAARGDRSDDRDDRTAGEDADTAQAARDEATEALDVARADEAAAADELEAAARQRDSVQAEEVRLTETLNDLQREIVRVRHELDGLTRSLAGAEREQQRRQRQLDQARKAVRQAEQALDQLD